MRRIYLSTLITMISVVLAGMAHAGLIAINVATANYNSQDRSMTATGNIASFLDTRPGISLYLLDSAGAQKATLFVNYMELDYAAGTLKPEMYKYEWSGSVPEGVTVVEGDQIKVSTNRQVSATKPITIESGAEQIDVLLLPTQQAIEDIKFHFNGRTIAEQKAILMDTVSRAFIASGLKTVELNLITSDEIMPEFASFEAGLTAIQTNETIMALRNSTKADLVIGLAPASLGAGGLAQGPCGGQPNSEVTFAAIVPAGSTYSFAHEVGHLLGGDHLQQNVPPNSPCRPNASYSYAYAVNGTSSSDLGYRTYVSTPGANGANFAQSSGMYSNPDATFPNGEPAGSATANNVQIFRDMAPFIANYR